MGHVAGYMSKCLMLEFCISVAFTSSYVKTLQAFSLSLDTHLFFFYFLLLSQTLRLFSKCPFLGHLSRSGDLIQFTFVRRRPLSVNNLTILTSWKLQGHLLLLSGTLLPLGSHRQKIDFQKGQIFKIILLYSKTRGKNEKRLWCPCRKSSTKLVKFMALGSWLQVLSCAKLTI